MNKGQVERSDLKPHPSNPNWTLPKSYGVWELPKGLAVKRYRFGNNPVREYELVREYGAVQLIALYLHRDSAKCHADELNHV